MRFDGAIRRAAETILGAPFNNQSYTQAALTPRLGGLGLRRVVDHADIAFAASRFKLRSRVKRSGYLAKEWRRLILLRKSALTERIKRSCKSSLLNPQILGKANAFRLQCEWSILLSPLLSTGTTR